MNYLKQTEMYIVKRKLLPNKNKTCYGRTSRPKVYPILPWYENWRAIEKLFCHCYHPVCRKQKIKLVPESTND